MTDQQAVDSIRAALVAHQRDIHYHPHIGKWTTWPQHGAGKSDVEATDLLSLAESLPEEG